MEQQFSTSKVTVEYFDPHDVYKLLSPGLIPRLPLHNLHWQSHAGPLRSIDTLHIDLVQGGVEEPASATSTTTHTLRRSGSTIDDGFQTQNTGGRAPSVEPEAQTVAPKTQGGQRRHQIPGLRRTPYLKVLLVRCDDNESYKGSVRSEVREWMKAHATPSVSSKNSSRQDNHDASEWLIVHVVIPNTVAATQPRASGKTEGTSDKTSSIWRAGSTPLLEKLRSDFGGTGKGLADRISQIRIGINDVPYDLLPRVVPAVPTGYSENEHDAENAWQELITRFKTLILNSFEKRVTQYEDDIKEKDGQRSLPGWNFCTFFILKEGLARGFESVGLVEDALVGYDELSVGLDTVIQEQAAKGRPERHGGTMLPYTEELKKAVEKAMGDATGSGDEEAVDLQATEAVKHAFDEIPISATKKAYRDMILANNVSVFDFRCYLFSRQIALLLRLGNAWSTREELIDKLREQQESVLLGVAPLAPPPPPKPTDDSENLSMLAEICRRTLSFVPSVSQVMREDLIAAMAKDKEEGDGKRGSDPVLVEVVENIVASFAFSVAQQILALTASRALPIPPSALVPVDGQEQKTSIPEPKTMIHPARTSSLAVRQSMRPPPSPGLFPGPGLKTPLHDAETQNFLKTGLEDLAARRAELYMLSRSVLDGIGKKRGWSDGWSDAPKIVDSEDSDFEDVDLDEPSSPAQEGSQEVEKISPLPSGLDSPLLQTAVESSENFYRLFEILTDKALRHYTVANHEHAVQANMADLAVLKFYLKDYRTAASCFYQTTPFFGESGWSLVELSMLVMYLKCLRELDAKDDYVKVALKLLTKSCAAEKERLSQKSHIVARKSKTEAPDHSSMKGIVGNLFDLATTLSSQVKIHLANFFTDIELAGPPEYFDVEDRAVLTINVRSLLPDDIKLDGVLLKVASVDGGPTKELKFTRSEEAVLSPGKNSVKIDCTTVVPGKYRVNHLALTSSNLFLHFDRDNSQVPPRTADIFKDPDVTVIQRADALDVTMTAAKHTALDRNNSLDLVLNTGWNSLKSCEIRVKPATGGLRLLTNEAKVVESSIEFAKPPEAGLFCFNSIEKGTQVALRFPFSIEQDMGDVAARLEVTYTTEADRTFFFAKAVSISISLALSVNVQDVFKHKALYSRFNVSTATASPLKLYKGELVESELFESEFGVVSTNSMTVFPKQPATLLYRIKRKAGGKLGKRSGKTMYLKLYYNVLQVEIEEAVRASLRNALESSPLKQYSRAIEVIVVREMKNGMQVHDLERAALLGDVTTSFLSDASWERFFRGLGVVGRAGDDPTSSIPAFLRHWQQSHPRISVPDDTIKEPSTILIPVEIPSLSVVHSADIRLQDPLPSLVDAKDSITPTVCTNQMISATLHLKWTRQWDTETTKRSDQEFGYEVTAPSDTWLLGGRRKGHFVIPASMSSSTPETEAAIPLIMIPLREGWLPYPNVEIREVTTGLSVEGMPPPSASEVDWRNLGETIRVISERKEVTISLDASGPGGGPLVLESQGIPVEKGRIVA